MLGEFFQFLSIIVFKIFDLVTVLLSDIITIVSWQLSIRFDSSRHSHIAWSRIISFSSKSWGGTSLVDTNNLLRLMERWWRLWVSRFNSCLGSAEVLGRRMGIYSLGWRSSDWGISLSSGWLGVSSGRFGMSSGGWCNVLWLSLSSGGRILFFDCYCFVGSLSVRRSWASGSLDFERGIVSSWLFLVSQRRASLWYENGWLDEANI